jgi:hypothetical protein
MFYLVFTRGCQHRSVNTNRTLFAYDSPSTGHRDRQEQLAPHPRRATQRSQRRAGKLHLDPQTQENRVVAVEQHGREHMHQAGRREKHTCCTAKTHRYMVTWTLGSARVRSKPPLLVLGFGLVPWGSSWMRNVVISRIASLGSCASSYSSRACKTLTP